ncbi:MAG: hypothetical protein Ta2D_12850 [Rickettsiales bacterium]|nr:MAG: hypothetical protein Ta2D_12850 [Rickettsiales bacterium]
MKKIFSLVLLLVCLISCTHIAGDTFVKPNVLVEKSKDEVCFLKDTRFLFWSFADENSIYCRNVNKPTKVTQEKSVNMYAGLNLQYDQYTDNDLGREETYISGMVYSGNIGFKYNVAPKIFVGGELLLYFNKLERDHVYEEKITFNPLFTINTIGGYNLTDKLFVFANLGIQFMDIEREYNNYYYAYNTTDEELFIVSGIGLGYKANKNIELKVSYTFSFDTYFPQNNFVFSANYLF